MTPRSEVGGDRLVGSPGGSITFGSFAERTGLPTSEEETRTMIFYESPYRLVKTLTQFIEYFGPERQVSVCREISKIHEESVRGTLTEVVEHFKANEPRGEIVVILNGKED